MADRSDRIPADMPEFDAAMRHLARTPKGGVAKAKREKMKKRKAG